MTYIQESDFSKWDGTLFDKTKWDGNIAVIVSALSSGDYDGSFDKLGIGTTTLNYQANIVTSISTRGLDILSTTIGTSIYGQYITLSGAGTTNYGLAINSTGAGLNYGYYNVNNASFDKLAYVTSQPSASAANGTLLTGYVSAQGKLYIRVNGAWHYINTTSV